MPLPTFLALILFIITLAGLSLLVIHLSGLSLAWLALPALLAALGTRSLRWH